MGICIALAGNPNCGKTTMFNDLTGPNQYVGNWPGVTVEKKEGKYTRDKDVTITDLPGIYSLSPYSPEEIVARDYLLEGGPDAVIDPTLHLPKIPGGKKLIYTQISMPLTAIADFEKLGADSRTGAVARARELGLLRD